MYVPSLEYYVWRSPSSHYDHSYWCNLLQRCCKSITSTLSLCGDELTFCCENSLLAIIRSIVVEASLWHHCCECAVAEWKRKVEENERWAISLGKYDIAHRYIAIPQKSVMKHKVMSVHNSTSQWFTCPLHLHHIQNGAFADTIVCELNCSCSFSYTVERYHKWSISEVYWIGTTD